MGETGFRTQPTTLVTWVTKRKLYTHGESKEKLNVHRGGAFRNIKAKGTFVDWEKRWPKGTWYELIKLYMVGK